MLKIKNELRSKKSMTISIVLLVLATLVLTSFSLLTFYLKKDKISEEIYTTRFLEDIYAKEETLNFYIDEIMEKAVEETKESNNFEGDFPINFLVELDKYKINDKFILEELQQVQEQVNENPGIFVFGDDKVTAQFQITLEDKVTVEEKELFSAVYTYKKTFEKEISDFNLVAETAPSIASADLTQKSRISGSNTVYDGYYINVNGERTEYFLIETLNGYAIMKEGSGDYYALVEEDKDWRILTYPDRPLPEYLQGKKFVKEGDIIYFKDE